MSLSDLYSSNPKPWCNLNVNNLNVGGILTVAGATGSTGPSGNVTAELITATVQLRGTALSNQLSLGNTNPIIIDGPTGAAGRIVSFPGFTGNASFILNKSSNTQTIANNLNISGNLSTNGTISATGDINANSNINLLGNLNIDETGVLNIGQNINIASGVSVNNKISVPTSGLSRTFKFMILVTGIPNSSSYEYLFIDSIPNDFFQCVITVRASISTQDSNGYGAGGESSTLSYLIRRRTGFVAGVDQSSETLNCFNNHSILNISFPSPTVTGGATDDNDIRLLISCALGAPAQTAYGILTVEFDFLQLQSGTISVY